ncbi:hypothetical protein MVES1_001547 [Malassezia vespertilionis]|uniref:uncharacterized protein n=1 Tax=Malassezia vespertilionis TaxID=2020962 RepID=UPI0024B0BC4E|nr:uncharacterized protein MVES1_001547 [Malassezia vespertilionis]WFD06205.1 hypothetical protein MVES1_001547 [Malassezia vespertilionis]
MDDKTHDRRRGWRDEPRMRKSYEDRDASRGDHPSSSGRWNHGERSWQDTKGARTRRDDDDQSRSDWRAERRGAWREDRANNRRDPQWNQGRRAWPRHDRREQSPPRAHTPPPPRKEPHATPAQSTEVQTQTVDTPSEELDADQIAAMMGFGNFGSSKGKPVEENTEGYAEVRKERTWRQYMNRKGGFNRPLDKV